MRIDDVARVCLALTAGCTRRASVDGGAGVAITADGVAAAAAAAAASTSPCYRLPLPTAGTAHAANATIVVGGNRTYTLTFTRRSAAEESTLYYHAIGGGYTAGSTAGGAGSATSPG